MRRLTVSERNPVVVLVLALLTCSLYGYVWLYLTTDELRRESGREELSPILDLVLAALTAGLWGLYASYRNARIAHEVLRARGVDHTDSSTTILVFNLSTFIWGGGWLVSLVLLQNDYNELARRSIVRGPLPTVSAT